MPPKGYFAWEKEEQLFTLTKTFGTNSWNTWLKSTARLMAASFLKKLKRRFDFSPKGSSNVDIRRHCLSTFLGRISAKSCAPRKESEPRVDYFGSSAVRNRSRAYSIAWVLLANRFVLICESIHFSSSSSNAMLVLIFLPTLPPSTPYYQNVYISNYPNRVYWGIKDVWIHQQRTKDMPVVRE